MANQSIFNCQQFGYNLQKLPQSYQYSFACLLISTAITSGCFNFLVILSIWKTPSLHNMSFILVANLALADFLSGIVGGLPLASAHILIIADQNGNLTSTICVMIRLSKGIVYLFCGVSIATLAAMSVDRLLAITLKTRYKNNRLVKRGFKVYLVACWLSLVCFAVFAFINVSENKEKSVFLAVFIFVALVVSAIVICYTFSYYILRRLTISMVSNNLNEDSLNLEKYRKVLKTVVIVCAFLLTSYTPFLVASFFVASNGMKETSERRFTRTIFLSASELLVYFSATVNPLLYSWRMSDLQKAIKALMKKRLCGCSTSTVSVSDG